MELNIALPEPNQDLENLKNSIGILSGYIEQYKDAEQLRASIERLDVILNALIRKMEKTPVEFFTNQIFKDLNIQIINIINSIKNYVGTGQTTYKMQISIYTDAIIGIVPRLCFNDKETIKESLSVTVGHYKRTLTNLQTKIKEYEKNITDNNIKIEKLNNKIAEQQSIINGFAQQFNDSQLKNNTVFTEKITEFNEKNTNNQDKIKTDWDSTKQSIKKEWHDIVEIVDKYAIQKKEEWTSIKSEYDNSFNDLKSDLTDSANITLAEIQKRKQEIEQLYGLVGKTVSCGEYKKYADGETIMIWVLYGLAFLIMLIISGFMAFVGYQDFKINQTINWLNMFARLPVALILYAPAFYLAMEAKKRHNHQIELRDFEIKISSIDPYLKNIDLVESEREIEENNEKVSAKDIKLELAKEFFSRNKTTKKDENIIIPKEVIDIVKQISEICNPNKNK